MIFLMIAAVIALLGWLTVRAMNREKAGRDRITTTRKAVLQTHGIEDVFVSPDDGSVIGLSANSEQVVLGSKDGTHALPTASLLAIEGVRDETVLIRAEPHGDPVSPAPVAEQGVTDLPERIRRLALRVTTTDSVFEVLFYEGGRHGVSPDNAQFRQQAARAEAWFRKVSTAMRAAR